MFAVCLAIVPGVDVGGASDRNFGVAARRLKERAIIPSVGSGSVVRVLKYRNVFACPGCRVGLESMAELDLTTKDRRVVSVRHSSGTARTGRTTAAADAACPACHEDVSEVALVYVPILPPRLVCPGCGRDYWIYNLSLTGEAPGGRQRPETLFLGCPCGMAVTIAPGEAARFERLGAAQTAGRDGEAGAGGARSL